jgi:hypothetical protein
MCSNLFFAKAKSFYFFQKFWNKTKTFLCVPTFFSKSKTLLFNPKNFRSERERFGSIMNFVSKTNIFNFLGDVSRKTKANVGLTLQYGTIPVWMYANFKKLSVYKSNKNLQGR